jgi:hypothetical protein
MAKAELSIELEKADRRYVPGETIRGKLRVRVDSDCRCDALTIERQWRTHGRGNRSSGGAIRHDLFQGDWRAGEYVYPFQFEAPAWPRTYHGHYLNVDWYLNARADVPWAIDPKAEEEILVEAGPERFVPDTCFPAETVVSTGAHPLQAGCPTIFGLMFVLIGLANLPIGIFFMVPGFIVAFLGLRNVLAEMKIGSVKLEVEPLSAEPGGAVRVVLSMVPKSALLLNEATVKLKGIEQVVSGSGTKKTTHTHTLHEAQASLSAKQGIVAGRPVRLETLLELPASAPPSFEAASNKLIWSLNVHLDIARWPDWTHDVALRVLPMPSGEAVLAAEARTGVPATARSAALGQAPVSPPPLPAASEPLEAWPAASEPLEAWPAASGTSASAEGWPAEAASEPVSAGRRDAADLPPQPPAEFAAPAAGAGGSELEAVLRRLAAAPAYGPQRDAILAEVAGHSFPLTMEVDRVEWLSGLDLPAAMQGGRALIGKAQGCEPTLAVRFPAARNAEIEALRRGARLDVQARLAGWDRLFDRPLFDAAGGPAAG